MTTRIVKTAVATLAGFVAFAVTPAAQESEQPYAHVLLISVDGLHASDLASYVDAHPESTFAALTTHGRTYTNAIATMPSDSFPGLLAMVTGGTPRTTGVYYDDSWDRSLAGDTTKPCTAGAEVMWKQNLDITYPVFGTFGAYATYWTSPGAPSGLSALNPNKLPRDPALTGCPAVLPHQFPRVNNVFELVKAAGGRTAWADKHPAYEFLNGPSGTGIDDLFTPEIAVPINGVTITNSFYLTKLNDDLKRDAIINQIHGLDHLGNPASVPTLFGMNFQAVSVGQKLKNETFAGQPAFAGGYNADGTPKTGLADALYHTDQSLGAIVAALNDQGLADSTLIIISAKHGNSPIDPGTLVKVNPSLLSCIVNNANATQPTLLAQLSADTGPLIWLKNQSFTSDVVTAFSQPVPAACVGFGNNTQVQGILAGSALAGMFVDPSLGDNRVPDIILAPIPGTVYTTSGTKIADHGGFGADDVHVALLVSNPALPSKTINDFVETRQIACTILKGLSMECDGLQSEAVEPSKFLPNSNHKNSSGGSASNTNSPKQ